VDKLEECRNWLQIDGREKQTKKQANFDRIRYCGKSASVRLYKQGKIGKNAWKHLTDGVSLSIFI
jgi:hypothetical protein